MTAKEYFNSQTVTGWQIVDKNAHKYSKNDLIKFAQAYHDSEVKKLNIPDVGSQRELLTAFAIFMVKNMAHGDTPACLVEQFYLKGGQ